MLHALIDIGSNTIRMAIYDIEGTSIDMLTKQKHNVGLAAYIVDGKMQQEGIDKAAEILTGFKTFLENLGINNITTFTTAALRNADNSEEAVAELKKRTGLDIMVISGDEEATFDFIGATHNLAEDTGLLIDIGGASTEIVYFKDNKIVQKASLPVGSLKLYTEYVEKLLPSPVECGLMKADVEKLLDESNEFENIKHARICGIGGTFKGAIAVYNALFRKGDSNFDMETARIREVVNLFNDYGKLNDADTILLLKTVPERVHTLLPGLIIAEVLAEHFDSQTITYSDSGVREGYIYDRIIGKN